MVCSFECVDRVCFWLGISFGIQCMCWSEDYEAIGMVSLLMWWTGVAVKSGDTVYMLEGMNGLIVGPLVCGSIVWDPL